MSKGKVIVIGNRKGGSGKTTTAKNLAYELSKLGRQVLLIDGDPQRNATEGLSGKEYKMSILGLLKHEDVHRCIYHTRFQGLDLIPGNDYLANEKIEDHIFVQQLEHLKERYDYILIDTSPYFNKLIAEIMRAHDLVIIPTEINDDSIRGTMTTINEITQLFPQAKFRILYTKVDRSKETQKGLQELQQQLAPVSFQRVIRYCYLPVKRARKYRSPLSYRYPHAKAAMDYAAIAKELLEVI